MNTRSDSTGAAPADYLTASPRLFEYALLDKLSRVHWTVPLYVYAPIIAVLVYLSFGKASVGAALGCMLFGYIAWTLTEYLGHRYLFHWQFPGEVGLRRDCGCLWFSAHLAGARRLHGRLSRL